MDTKLSEIDLFEVYTKWNYDLDAYKCFCRSTNFVSLKHYPDFELSQVPAKGGEYFNEISHIIKKYSFKDTLFLLDINGTEAIKTAFFIRKEFMLAAILIFNGVLHPYGLIGDKEYISYLLGYGLKNEDIDKQGYLLVLDHNRYSEYTDEELKKNFNNQYELGEEDLPSVEMLNSQGYRTVVYIYEHVEKEDLTCYLEYLSQANVNVEKVQIVMS